MKKNLWYLLALFCCLNFFACGDDDKGKDDDDDDDKDWTDYTGTFGEDNPLLLNGEKIEDGSVKAVFAKGTTDGKAKLTLTGLGLWEQETVVFDDLTVSEKEGNYVFTSTEGLGDTDSKLEVTGTLAPGSRTRDVGPTPVSLTLTTTYSIESDIVGSWDLQFNDMPGFGVYAGFDIEISALAQQDPALATQLSMGVGKLIANKVEEVKVEFKANGTFDFKWKSVDATNYTTLADVLGEKLGDLGAGIAKLLVFEYYVEGDVVNIGISPAKIGLNMETLLPLLGDYADVLELLESKNGYYYLPIQFEEGENVRFYQDKAFIAGLLEKVQKSPTLGALLGSLLQGDIMGYPISNLMTAIENSETVEVGLTFTK